jgi:copper chaperone CopZ
MNLRVAFLLILGLAVPAAAQFRKIEIGFDGAGCGPCIESLPNRIKRMRGVESAEVDPAKGILRVALGEQNRVRLEQVRDAVEQDGTKTRWAEVELRGEVARSETGWKLSTPGGAAYALSGDLSSGTKTVAGRVSDTRAIRIAVSSVRD